MKIVYKDRFDKQFKKLSQRVKNQFYERLKIFINNKFNYILNNHSVEKRFPGCRSINIKGDYRAIFKDENNTITFSKIGTHSELYR